MTHDRLQQAELMPKVEEGDFLRRAAEAVVQLLRLNSPNGQMILAPRKLCS